MAANHRAERMGTIPTIRFATDGGCLGKTSERSSGWSCTILVLFRPELRSLRMAASSLGWWWCHATAALSNSIATPAESSRAPSSVILAPIFGEILVEAADVPEYRGRAAHVPRRETIRLIHPSLFDDALVVSDPPGLPLRVGCSFDRRQAGPHEHTLTPAFSGLGVKVAVPGEQPLRRRKVVVQEENQTVRGRLGQTGVASRRRSALRLPQHLEMVGNFDGLQSLFRSVVRAVEDDDDSYDHIGPGRPVDFRDQGRNEAQEVLPPLMGRDDYCEVRFAPCPGLLTDVRNGTRYLRSSIRC